MNKRLFTIVSVLLITSMALGGCGGPGASGKTIKIATQSPLSGSMSAMGSDIKNGVQLAVEQLSGPLVEMGFKVELAPFDDQADPNTGVANAKNIVSDPAIMCVVGHYNSGVQIPSSEEYHTAGLANVSPCNTNPKVTDRGYLEVSRVVGRDDMQGAVGAQFAASKGMKSAYILHDKTAYGQGIAEYFKREAENVQVEILGLDGTREKDHFDTILAPILAANPDVIYFGGMYDQAAVLFRQAREKGYQGMFLSDDGFDSSEASKIGGEALLQGAGTYFSTVTGPASLHEGTQKFIEDFTARFGHTPQPSAAQSYDSAGICLQAITEAAKANGNNMPTRSAVAHAVRTIKDYPGITGVINFNARGDLTAAKYFIIQVTSTDPEKWSENRVDKTLTLAPPQ